MARWLRVICVLGLCAVSARGQAEEPFAFHRENVLGSTMSLSVRGGSEAQARAAENAALKEIERLAAILSRWDAKSELSALNATNDPVKASPELIEVLNACEAMRVATGGAFNALVGNVGALWKKAEADKAAPGAEALAEATRLAQAPGWAIDAAAGTVKRTGAATIDVDGLAVGFILDRAMPKARAADADATGMLLDLGGDILCFDTTGTPWRIAIADPANPAENAAPLGSVSIANGAMTQSGSYARQYDVGGVKYSRIIDPRTGAPVATQRASTVVAPDAVTADAWATALCVAEPAAGLKLAEAIAGVQAMVLEAGGKQSASAGFGAMARMTIPVAAAVAVASAVTSPTTVAAAGAWPEGYKVDVTVELIGPATAPGARPSRGFKRQYMAIWIEDSNGRYVRTVTFLGTVYRYAQTMNFWMGAVKSNQKAKFDTVARATRMPGVHTFVWDGKNDAGEPVRQGEYTVKIDVSREHGRHFEMEGKIVCGDAPASGSMPDNAEARGVKIEYKAGGAS